MSYKSKNTPDSRLSRSWTAWLVNIGLLAIVAATALPLFHVPVSTSRVIYAVGAVVLLAGRVLTPAPGDVSLRLRRMVRMETWSALIFVVGAVLMFYPDTAGTRDWIAFTLAGGVLQVYTSIMIPRLQRDEK